MHIEQALSEARITANLAVSGREAALSALAHTFAASDERLCSTQVEAALRARERLASTNLGEGVAIPHARIPGLGEPQVAVAIAREGVEFDVDGPRVHILVGLLSQDDQPAAHLAALAKLANLLRSPAVRERLQRASSASDVLDAMCSPHEEVTRRIRIRRRLKASAAQRKAS